MKNPKLQFAPTKSKEFVLHQSKVDSFKRFPNNMDYLTDAEFRAMGPLYENFANHRTDLIADRGISRKSLKTHVKLLDIMKEKKWVGMRGAGDAVVYLTPKGAKVYEFAYYYYAEKDFYRLKFYAVDNESRLEQSYLKAMPRELRQLLDIYPSLDYVKVYRTYRKLGKLATLEFYENQEKQNV